LNISNIRLINWSTKQCSAADNPIRLNPSESGSACPRNKKRDKQQGRGNITGGREVPISRRQFVSTAAGAGIASVVAPRLTLAQNSGPIRIGLLAAKTGPLASGGIDMELALTMFLKERDNTLAGVGRPPGSSRPCHQCCARDYATGGATSKCERANRDE